MEHLDIFQHLHFLNRASFVSQRREKPLESSLSAPHQGLAGSMGLEKPLDQLEGKRKVLEAELSTCQHSQSIPKSRKWWECSLQCIGKRIHTTGF